ncbi:MAG: hypothetical protein LUG95_05040 [Clostridiales bacterium]|nr:hypothetical protein [Clostridiales bacterium]
MIKKILCCIAGTLCFTVTMNAPRRTLLYITIGAGLTSAIERFLNGYYGDLTACFAAMLCLVFTAS